MKEKLNEIKKEFEKLQDKNIELSIALSEIISNLKKLKRIKKRDRTIIAINLAISDNLFSSAIEDKEEILEIVEKYLS